MAKDLYHNIVRNALIKSVDISGVYSPVVSTQGRLNVKRAIAEIQNSTP